MQNVESMSELELEQMQEKIDAGILLTQERLKDNGERADKCRRHRKRVESAAGRGREEKHCIQHHPVSLIDRQRVAVRGRSGCARRGNSF